MWWAHLGAGQKKVRNEGRGTQRKEKKDEIWYYSQVAKVRLWTESAVSHRLTTNNNKLTYDWCIRWCRHVANYSFSNLLEHMCMYARVYKEFKITIAVCGSLAVRSRSEAPSSPSLACYVQWSSFLFGRGFKSRVNQYILNKKERYIKFSFKLRILHLNIVKEYIVIYYHQCVMVDRSCCGDR